MGKKIKKEAAAINDTTAAIEFLLSATSANVAELRRRGGDILTLQALNYLFSGNPVALFAHRQLAEEALSCAESVRGWAKRIFARHGGTGPEVIDRVIGPERQSLLAADQALTRFHAFLEVASEAMRKLEPPTTADDDARRFELIKLASERELTAEEHDELMRLRAKLREQIASAPVRPATPAELQTAAAENEEVAAHAIDVAMASGELPPLPEGTSQERARELYFEAMRRALTPEEKVELGIAD